MPALIYLGFFPVDPCGDSLAKKMLHHYTCSFFDAEHKLCKVYEHRPHTCRDFPNAGKCRYTGCDFEHAPEVSEPEVSEHELRAQAQLAKVAQAQQPTG